ncbi:MAG: DUF2252 domain-containing protein [bacterium]|nr:DUF2252 domain-containing protein [bacterium]
MRHDRASRVVNALAGWNEHLTADDLHQKYCKMGVSPFVFYRGTAHLFWADFAGAWRMNRFGSSRTRTWLQGDAHAENMGAFTDHEGELLYGLNDFDESVLGDYQYDLWRFAVSLVLVARRNGGFSGKEKANVINAYSESYLDTMHSLAEGKVKASDGIFTVKKLPKRLRDFMKEVEEEASRKKMLEKWTTEKKGERRFKLSYEKLDKASKWERGDIEAAMPDYGKTLSGSIEYGKKFFRVRDIARRLSAGTGSLGTPRYYVLIRGEGKSWKDDRILDLKRQSSPSGLGYLSAEEQIDYNHDYQHHAHRHAVAYKALGKHPDHLMGWMRLHDGVYSVRERSPFKETYDTTKLTSEKEFVDLARIWAKVLASDHACAVRDLEVDDKSYSIAREVTKLTTGGRNRPDFLALVRDQAFEYANQVEADYATFKDAMDPTDCKGII